MISDVKRLKIEELNKQKKEFEEKKADITRTLDEKSRRLEELQNEQYNGLTVRSRFSFLQKWITKRDEYKKYKEQMQRMRSLPQMISEADFEMQVEKKKVETKLKDSGIDIRIKEIEQRIISSQYSNTLYELGVTPEEAIKLLEANEIQPVLTEEDKQIFEHPRNYTSKSSLIGVHKTKYPPVGNLIKSSKDANVKYEKTVTINGEKHTYLYKSARDTVHMAMNDEVSSHTYGSWEDCEYAVLMPFEDIPNEKVGRAEPMDTFTRGSISLSENAWILCPKDEVGKVKQANPKVHVLGYEGENVKGFSKPFLTQLGYRGESVGMWSWYDGKSTSDFDNLIMQEGIKRGGHTYTYFHEDEEMLANINMAVSLSKFLRDKKFIKNPEDVANISRQLTGTGEGFDYMLSGLCLRSSFENDIEPDAVVANNRQGIVFIEEMKKNGFYISPAYQNVIKKLCEVTLYDCADNAREDVFDVSEDATDRERENIKKFQAELFNGKHDDRKGAWGIFISDVIGETILHSREKDFLRSV